MLFVKQVGQKPQLDRDAHEETLFRTSRPAQTSWTKFLIA
jgi:hypothetical protein